MTNLKFSAFIALIAFTFLVTILVEPLVAQEDTSQANEDLRIQFIEVEGSQRVEAETVRSYMILKPGMTADPVLLDQSLKSMFASGLFADVTIRRERGGLIVTVVENPIVNRVIFEGNDKLDDDDLYEESSLRPRQVYTRSKIQNDVEKFVELYRRPGRLSATVAPKAHASVRLISSVMKDLTMTDCARRFPRRSHVGGAFYHQMINMTPIGSLMIVTYCADFISAKVMRISA